ncbi:MAG TPA: glycosyltransferase family 4 protein, partial [Anaerolineaceae bacterium]|nr:glycosyltransferase family 4 protein [Anaerolineaceae bacterium]
MTSICIYPPLKGLGGPASFFARLSAGLRERGYVVHSNPSDPSTSAILQIGGTKRLDLLWRARRRGVRIVQRLNGMNWIHRKTRTGLKHYIRSEYSNWLLAVVRRRLAHAVIYQSQFARSWWQTVYGNISVPTHVVYNGVDVKTYTPQGPGTPPADHFRLLLVEGHLKGGHETGLDNAIHLARALRDDPAGRWELMVAGEVPPEIQSRYQNEDLWITLRGVVRREDVAEMDRSAHVLFSADLNAACPNAVIEALACGLPVVSFATGSLPELLQDGAGIVVPYGSNYWNLEPPVLEPLAAAAQQLVAGKEISRRAARARAEAMF